MDILKKVKGFKADIGGRKEQQDFATGKKIFIGYVVVVCDGVGGEQGGAIAAQLTVETIVEELAKLVTTKSEKIRAALGEVLKIANDKVLDYARNYGPSGMATTATITLFTTNKVYFCHVGDSRIYQIRKGKIIHRTIDHTQVQDKVRRGELSQEEGDKNTNSPISRCIGRAGLYTGEIDENDYKKGDRFLACTDGIYGPISEKILIKKAADKKLSLEEIGDDILSYIKQNTPNPRGLDNMTMALVETNHSSKRKIGARSSGRWIKIISFGITLGLFLTLAVWAFWSSQNTDDIAQIEQALVDIQKQKEELLLQVDSLKKGKNMELDTVLVEKHFEEIEGLIRPYFLDSLDKSGKIVLSPGGVDAFKQKDTLKMQKKLEDIKSLISKSKVAVSNEKN